MAQSISKAQADALADGFLDGFGESAQILEPKKSLSALLQLAGFLVQTAQENLVKSNSVASGNLSESIKAHDPKKIGKTIRVEISMEYYGKFINKGVRGTKKKGNGQYSFKYSNPSKKMVKAIEVYMKKSGQTIRNIGRQGPQGKNESKKKSISELSAAYVVARSIKIKGIRKTGFMDKAVSATSVRARSVLGSAFRADVIDSLPKRI